MFSSQWHSLPPSLGLRPGAGVPAPRSAPARCSACFAAEIVAPDLTPNTAISPSGLADYGSVVLYQPENTWDAVSRQNVDAALALLPETVRTELGNPALGPVFVTVNDSGSLMSGQQPYGKAANFFSTSDKTSQVVLYPDQPVKVVLHELGHAYNLRGTPGGSYGQAYLSPELQDFMKAVSWRLLTPAGQLVGQRDQDAVAVTLDGPNPWTDLSHNDPLEDFANSFALFFAAPAELQQLSPARYEWFAGHFAT